MSARPDHDPRLLAGRLNAGWLMIDHEPDSERRASLERHWLILLRRYEAACDGADHRPERKADDRFAAEVRHGN